MRTIKSVLIILLTGISVMAFSQKNKRSKAVTDTTVAIKEFMTVCSGYKALPFHLSLVHSNSATISTSEEDTITANAEFYMTEQGAYIRYGNMEQIVNDSLVLMISSDQQVMMLYQNQGNMQEQIKKTMGWQMADSSISKAAAGYSSVLLPAEQDKKIIELRNRLPLQGTDIAKEIITLKYDSRSKEPEQVIHIRRTLVPVDKAEWDSLPGHEKLNDKLVAIKDSYFIVNERKGVFEYKKISHDADLKLPVSIYDRIMRNTEGKYVPVKGFEGYYLSVD